jgi:hypothetical protein
MASATFLKTGRPRCWVPAFLGFVPPTTLVPAVVLTLSTTVSKSRIGWAHTVFNGLLCVETIPTLTPRPIIHFFQFLSPSLLSGEALEQHLGVAVDAEVLDRLCVLRRACRILPGRRLGQRRAQRLSDCLHRDCGGVTEANLRYGEGIAGRGVDGSGLKLRHSGTSSGQLGQSKTSFGQGPSAPDNLTKTTRGSSMLRWDAFNNQLFGYVQADVLQGPLRHFRTFHVIGTPAYPTSEHPCSRS